MRQMLRKIKALSSRATGPVSLLLFGQTLTAVSAFLVNILSARALDPEARGLLALYVQLSYLITTALLLGTERPYVAVSRNRFAVALRELSHLTRFRVVGLLAILAISVSFWVGGLSSWAIAAFLIGVYAAGNVWIRLFRVSYIASSERRPYIRSILLVQGGLLLVSVTLAIAQVGSPYVWFTAYSVTTLSVLVYGRLVMSKVPIDPRREPTLRQIRTQGYKVLPASFGNTALLRSDRLLLPILASPAELGVYVVVATILELAVWPFQQWADTAMHKWRRSNSNGFVRGLLMRTAALSILITGIVSVVALVTLHWILPASYSGSAQLIPMLALGSILYSIARIQQGLLLARNKASMVSIVEVVGMSVSVCAYLLLIPRLGAQGAAIGSTLGYGACALVAGISERASRGRTPETLDSDLSGLEQ